MAGASAFSHANISLLYSHIDCNFNVLPLMYIKCRYFILDNEMIESSASSCRILSVRGTENLLGVQEIESEGDIPAPDMPVKESSVCRHQPHYAGNVQHSLKTSHTSVRRSSAGWTHCMRAQKRSLRWKMASYYSSHHRKWQNQKAIAQLNANLKESFLMSPKWRYYFDGPTVGKPAGPILGCTNGPFQYIQKIHRASHLMSDF